MMSRPVSAVGYWRPLSHHARTAMMLRPDMRYKVSSFSPPFSVVNVLTYTYQSEVWTEWVSVSTDVELSYLF